MTNIKILISNSELGAGTRGSSLGPEAVRIAALEAQYPLFEEYDCEHIFDEPLKYYMGNETPLDHLEDFVPLYETLCGKTSEALYDYDKLVIFSGDHSNAPGFFSALKDNNPEKKIGLIWIDAHGDIHSPYTTPSGNVHGMPMAILLAHDNIENKIRDLDETTEAIWNKMKLTGSMGISPKLLPEDVVMIDLRDLEEEEWKIIHKLKIKHFTPKDRKKIGIEKIIEETKKYFSDYDQVYISFDVDSLDSSIVPGTGTPVENGLSKNEAAQLLKAFWNLDQCMALEFTEINPLLDERNKVAKVVISLLKEII